MFAYREKCYRFVPTEKHWDQAQNDCRVKGGNLVQIHDQATQNFIYTTAKSTLGWRVNGMWIGAHDQRVNEKWEWVVGKGILIWVSVSLHLLSPERFTTQIV